VNESPAFSANWAGLSIDFSLRKKSKLLQKEQNFVKNKK